MSDLARIANALECIAAALEGEPKMLQVLTGLTEAIQEIPVPRADGSAVHPLHVVLS